MPGAAKVRKPYWINFNKETSFRGTEPATGNQTALSGQIQETPAFKPSNNPIKSKGHSEIGANKNVNKGAFNGTISWSEVIQDLRPLARLMGNTIDMIRIIKGLTISGGTNIITGGTVTGGTSAAKGLVEQVTFPYDGLAVAVMVTGPVTFGGGTATIVRFTSTTVTMSDIDTIVPDGTTFTITSNSATFDANLAVGQIVDLILTQFTKDEALTFTGSSETATGLSKIEGVNATIVGSSGSIVDTDVMTGDASGALAGITTVTSQTALILSPFTLAEAISVDGTVPLTYDSGSQASFIYQHQIAANRNQNSYVLNYALESLADQHLCKGCVIKTLGLSSAANEAPKFNEDWLLGEHETDSTIDDEVTNSLDLYEYVDISTLSIDGSIQDGSSTDWTDILKTFDATFNRSNKTPIDSHTTQNPTGFKGAEVESTLSLGIHREDETIWDLNLGATDDDFAVIMTFVRGVSGEDDYVITYATCRAYEIEEAGPETIFLTIPVEVKGTPTIVVNDTIADYST